VVTGATGMLGAHLACQLQLAGYAVRCIQHKTGTSLFQHIAGLHHIPFDAFEWVTADILDTDSLEDAFQTMDAVFHCAAAVTYRKADEELLYETNVVGTRNCCNVSLKLGISTFVYASSIAALGKSTSGAPINENTPWIASETSTFYSETKHEAELEVWRAAEEGLKVCILNPGVIIGAGDGWSGSNAIFAHIRKGASFCPKGRTGFVGVTDVARAMIVAAQNAVFGARILLVAENIFYRDMLAMIADQMRLPAPTRVASGLLLRLSVAIARFCEFLRIPFPYPSQGILSTSRDSLYISANIGLLPGFVFTPMPEVVKRAVSGLPV
jgi:dihydroflavonol-4-reductase